MNFKPFNNFLFNYNLVHVEIDDDKKLIRRTFNKNLPNVANIINPLNKTEKEINLFFNNEIYWLQKLQGSKFIPELISIDFDNQQIIQKFYSHSCLITKKFPKIDSVVEMYIFFKEHQLNKINGSLSNMCFNNEQLVAFDFKHTVIRPNDQEREIYSYDNYLNKIDKELPKILKDLLIS